MSAADRRTRRSLLAGSLAPAAESPDLAELAGLVAVERAAVIAYGRVLATELLGAGERALAATFAAHEQAHEDALAAELRARGGGAPEGLEARAAGVLARAGLDRRLAGLRTAADAVGALVRLEAATEAAHHGAAGRLRDPSLARLAAELLAAEAGHSAALNLLAGASVARAVPDAFVVGRA